MAGATMQATAAGLPTANSGLLTVLAPWTLVGAAGALRGTSGDLVTLGATVILFGLLSSMIPMNVHKTCGTWFSQRQLGLANGVVSMGMAMGFTLGSLVSATLMSPWLGGGKMVHEVSFDGFTTQSAPWKLEAGTPNVAGVIGLSAALEWLADYDINQAESWSRSLATLAEDALAKRPGFRSFRCQDSSLLAFDFAGVHHSDMVTLLAEYGIALRAGQHCAQPLLAELGVTGTLRASFAPYNTKSDVDALVNAVDRALELLVD